jgi:hypothetical protein
MHDARIGRFWSLDPLAKKYPQWAPYVFSGNRVIDAIELEGLEPGTPMGYFAEGMRQYFDAVFSTVTAEHESYIKNENPVSQTKTNAATVTTKVVTKKSANFKVDFSDVFNRTHDNKVKLSDENLQFNIKNETKKAVEVTTKVKGPVDFSAEQSTNEQGKIEKRVEVTVGLDSKNVEANAFVAGSNSKDGKNSSESKTQIEIGLQGEAPVSKNEDGSSTYVGTKTQVNITISDDKE